MSNEIDNIIEQYKNKKNLYEKFETTLNEYLKEIIQNLAQQENPIEMGENDIEIKSRTKSPSSLKGKIERKNYENPLAQITDLVGAKIMLTSLRYAELIYELIKEKFSTVVIEEIDKSKILKDERKFGYLGKHIVIRCDKNMEIEKFREFDGMSAEIQIKTLLQHTWAEIEHKLRYKPQVKLDEEKQRYFDRLAAMMEIADDLFTELILEWEKISNKKSQKISEEIKRIEEGDTFKNEINLLDSESISFYLNDEKIKQKFNYFKNKVEGLLILEEIQDFVNTEFIELLELAGIYGTKKLNEILDNEMSLIILQEYKKHLRRQIYFHKITIMQILIYAQLDSKTREKAKDRNLIYRNVSEIIDKMKSI